MLNDKLFIYDPTFNQTGTLIKDLPVVAKLDAYYETYAGNQRLKITYKLLDKLKKQKSNEVG